MSKKLFLFSFLCFFMIFAVQAKVEAQGPDNLPKAPDWEFGWDNITTLKQAKPKEIYWNTNPIYDNQKVINGIDNSIKIIF